MSRRQLILTYCSTLFILTYGIDMISASKYGLTAFMWTLRSPFNVSLVMYAGLTLIMARVVFKKVYGRGKVLQLVAGVIGLIVFFILLRYFIEEIIYPILLGHGNYNPSTRFGFYVLDNIYYALFYITIGFLLFIFDRLVGMQKQQLQLMEKNREAELQFLRSQVNPHFLFNTLNNIYSLVYEKSDKAPAAMLKLSELMRYVLYEKKELVPLEKEWSYINSFIELQKLRFDESVTFPVILEGRLDRYEIAPHLLIPFVENAFKHANFREPSGAIDIRLSVNGDELLFTVQNRTGDQNKDETGGVGLENVRRRLELIYPGRHTLETTEGNNVFTIQLRLQLNP